MATEKQLLFAQEIKNHPALLITGNDNEHLEKVCIASIHTALCLCSNASFCSTKQMLEQRQHYNLLWLTPEKQYTKQDLESLFYTTSFTLEKNSHFFCVMVHAERMNASVANSLLKLIEEPLAGYHLIFLTQHPEDLVPAIRSRCIIKHYFTEKPKYQHELLQFFTHQKQSIEFLAYLDRAHLNEFESNSLLEELHAEYYERYNQALINQSSDISNLKKKCTLLFNLLQQPPMPGSAKIFWKNIFLQFHMI